MTYRASIGDKENESELDYGEHLRYSTSTHHSTSSSHNGDRRRESSHEEEEKRFAGGSNYHHNKRLSRTSQRTKRSTDKRHGRGTRHSNASTKKSITAETTTEDSDNVIAVFGAYGVTGHYFLKFALEAGYHVRCLMLPGIQIDDMSDNPNLTMVTGTFDDESKIHRVIRKAAYVVCMLNDCDSPLQNQTPPSNFSFIQKLVPIMEQCAACRVLMYQATSYALDVKGATPLFSNMVKKMAIRKSRRDHLQEQDQIVQYICTQSNPELFQFIITRPSNMVWDRPSRKKLAASKSQPGPFPITNIDLAEFSLNALRLEKLYNTCPYVVQDGI